jgi:hypothetical protein
MKLLKKRIEQIEKDIRVGIHRANFADFTLDLRTVASLYWIHPLEQKKT